MRKLTLAGSTALGVVLGAADMLGEMAKEARPMTAGIIVAMRDNTLYVTPDRPMQGGTMLPQAIGRSPKH